MKRTLKKAVSILLVLALLLPVAAMPAGAEELTWGDFRYEIGTNAGAEYAYVKLTGYTGEATELTLPSEIDGLPVAVVESLVGGECPARLVIPEGVKVIQILFGKHSEALEEVVLPESLRAIGGVPRDMLYDEKNDEIYGGGAFLYATSLTTLTVPPAVTLISALTFPETLTLRGEKGSFVARWAAANEQPFEAIAHECTVGDLNADGLCNTTDARLALQYAAGVVVPTAEQSAAADVDRSGKADTTDARQMLQYAAGVATIETIAVPTTFDVPLLSREEIDGALVTWRKQALPAPQEEVALDNADALADQLNAAVCRTYNSYPIIVQNYMGLRVHFNTQEGRTWVSKATGFTGIFYYGVGFSLSPDEPFYVTAAEAFE